MQVWADRTDGGNLSVEEINMLYTKIIRPNKIYFKRIHISNDVELLEFADGSVFERVKKEK